MNLEAIDIEFELWLPQDEEYYKHGKWLEKNYPSNTEIISIMFESKNGNITTEKNLKNIRNIVTTISKLQHQYDDLNLICIRFWSADREENGCLTMRAIQSLATMKLEYLDFHNTINKTIKKYINSFEKHISGWEDTYGNFSDLPKDFVETWRQIEDILKNKMVIDI